MLTRIQALNYKCLRHIDQTLDSFDVLVGPNGSGKTTFLDIISFLSDMVSLGLSEAVSKRTATFQDLVWERSDSYFELAIEARAPSDLLQVLPKKDQRLDIIRYQIRIGIDPHSKELSILKEWAFLKDLTRPTYPQMDTSILRGDTSESIFEPIIGDFRPLMIKTSITEPIVYFHESTKLWSANRVEHWQLPPFSYFRNLNKKGQAEIFKLNPTRSALSNLPEDETKFPIAIWFMQLLANDVQLISLSTSNLETASPAGLGLRYKSEGSNLPWLIEDLRKKSKPRFRDWIRHLQTALPDIEDIRTIERPEDRHRYLMVKYQDNVEIPSWMLSDGTLRLLALTLPAYLPDIKGIFLVEEPENGIHPIAIETVFQSLSSVYDAQVLLATHSPLILNIANLKNILCFSKSDEGATTITKGDKHPLLMEWRGEVNLGSLFAAGVLG